MNEKPKLAEYGYDTEDELLAEFVAVSEECARLGVAPKWSDLSPSFQAYNEDLLAWHAATGEPFETDAEYREKLKAQGIDKENSV